MAYSKDGKWFRSSVTLVTGASGQLTLRHYHPEPPKVVVTRATFLPNPRIELETIIHLLDDERVQLVVCRKDNGQPLASNPVLLEYAYL